jgi:hypothetical protein
MANTHATIVVINALSASNRNQGDNTAWWLGIVAIHPAWSIAAKRSAILPHTAR